MKNKPVATRIAFAIAGISEAIKKERSFRTQLALGAAAVLVTAALRPGLVWAAAVALSIGLVLALELVNSGIERLIDHLHPQTSPAVAAVKDMAAGAVLVASASTVVVALLMILSKFGF